MSDGHHGRILIVDKNANSASIISSMLEAWGYTVEVVYTPKAVLEILKDEKRLKPDLVLVEIINQDSEAFRLPLIIHQLPEWSHLPIVAHSVLSDRSAVVNAVNCGYADYIVRPTDPDLLREKIISLLVSSTKIDGSTYAFPVSQEAKVIFDFKVTAISEFGIEGLCDHYFEPNSIVKMDSELLKPLQLSNSPLRVSGCDAIPMGPHKYKVALTYVALTDQTAKLIRQYIIRNSRNAPRFAPKKSA